MSPVFSRHSPGAHAPGEVLLVSLLLLGVGGHVGAGHDLVLENVSVIDVVRFEVQPHMHIGITGGRIAEISPSPIQGAGRRLDGTGKFVVPGFIDMHAHATFLDFTVVQGTGGARTFVSPRFNPEVTGQALRRLLGSGVTVIRNPAAPASVGVRIRDELRAGRLVGPEMRVAGNSINLRPATEHAASPDTQTEAYVASIAEVRGEVRRQAALGVDFIKVYKSLPPEYVGAAIGEARELGLPVIGDLGRTTWREAARLGISALTHLLTWNPRELPEGCRDRAGAVPAGRSPMQRRIDWLECYDPDAPEVTRMIEDLVTHRVVVDPTLVAQETKLKGDWEYYTHSPDLSWAPSRMLALWKEGTFTSEYSAADYRRAHAAWPKLERLVSRMYQAGVHLTVGTDTPNPWVIPGISLHREMELLVQAGIPPRAVVRMATFDAARALGIEAREGSVAVGTTANLVVLSGNPYDDIRNTRSIVWVIHKGKLVGGL